MFIRGEDDHVERFQFGGLLNDLGFELAQADRFALLQFHLFFQPHLIDQQHGDCFLFAVVMVPQGIQRGLHRNAFLLQGMQFMQLQFADLGVQVIEHVFVGVQQRAAAGGAVTFRPHGF